MSTARRWTAKEDALIRRLLPRGCSEVARRIGCGPGTARRRAIALGLPVREYQEWTPAEDRRLRELVARGFTVPRIAEALGRPPGSVHWRKTALGLLLPPTVPFSLSRLGLLFGYCHSSGRRWVRRWLEAGVLRASWDVDGGVRFYPGPVAEFLRTHPCRYDRHRIPATFRGKPNPLLAWVPKTAPVTAGYVTRKQASRLIGIGRGQTLAAIRDGRLPACRLQGAGISPCEWWIKREDAEEAKRRVIPWRAGRKRLLERTAERRAA